MKVQGKKKTPHDNGNVGGNDEKRQEMPFMEHL